MSRCDRRENEICRLLTTPTNKWLWKVLTVLITNKRHSVAKLQNDAWRTKPLRPLWRCDQICDGFSYRKAVEIEVFLPLLHRSRSVMGANNGMDCSIDDRQVQQFAILSNSITWRGRMLFSREAGDRGFSLQRVLIWKTPVGCCIDKGAEAPFWTSCLFGRRDRHWHRSRRFWSTVPAMFPVCRLLLLRFCRLQGSYDILRWHCSGFCLPASRSDVSVHSERVIREEGTFW